MPPLAEATIVMLEHGLAFVQNNPNDEIFSLQDRTDQSKLCRLFDQPLAVVVQKIPVLKSHYDDLRSRSKLRHNLRTAKEHVNREVARSSCDATPTKSSSSSVVVASTVTPPPAPASSRIDAPYTAPNVAKKTKRAKPAPRYERESFDTKLGKLADFQLSFAESMQHRMECLEQEHLSSIAKQRRVNDETEAEIDGIKAELAEIKRCISYNVTTRSRRA
jgi:hypothetical protein